MAAVPPILKPAILSVPPLILMTAFSVPAPPVRVMLPASVVVPPLRLMLELAVAPVPALAMLMVLIPTLPPLMLRFAFAAPVLLLTAIVILPMVVVGTPAATLSPKFTVAVVVPAVPLLLDMFNVVTSREP